jgi:dipeptidyl peptidase-like protein
LAGRVIASHYAEPVERRLAQRVVLRDAAAEDAAAVRELAPGEPFEMLDDTLGWAWGYAGEDRRVGYVASSALEAC